MKNLSSTAASEINPDEFNATNYLNAREVAQAHANLIAYGTTKAKTQQYGVKHFLRCTIEGDPEDVEYTISFTDRSPAFAQLEKVRLQNDERTTADPDASMFPFRFRVREVGKSFGLEDATNMPTPLGKNWAPAAADTSQSALNTNIPF